MIPPRLAAVVDFAYNSWRADVAELADAIDLGSIARKGVEVRVLSSASWVVAGPWPSGKASPLQGEDRRFESDRVHSQDDPGRGNV